MEKKRSIPSNYDFLDEESRLIIDEQLCRKELLISHSHKGISPLLKSKPKIKAEVGRLKHGP